MLASLVSCRKAGQLARETFILLLCNTQAQRESENETERDREERGREVKREKFEERLIVCSGHLRLIRW